MPLPRLPTDSSPAWQLSNLAYDLTLTLVGGQPHVRLYDRRMDTLLADDAYIYRAARPVEGGLLVSNRLLGAAVRAEAGSLVITGQLAGLLVEQRLTLPAGAPVLEERMSLRNDSGETAALADLACGFQRRISNSVGLVLPDLRDERLAAIPFRRRTNDMAGGLSDFALADFLVRPGQAARVDALAAVEHGYYPAMQRQSEAWAWSRGGHTLGIFHFNQAAMTFSALGVELAESGVRLRFGGAALVNGEPAALTRLTHGQWVDMGLTRLETVAGGHAQASLAYRAFLDARGCRFPADFNPPVHWNELYDNPEYNVGTPGHPPGQQMTRPQTYTRALLLEEARKARDYGCEALYLDPGWDTDFGTLLWGEDWLGDCADFVAQVRRDYGLSVSLHCPLATWAARDGRAVDSWPAAALCRDADGQHMIWPTWNDSRAPALCLGARQYLDEAERRLLTLCDAGVSFLMFDGNWWNGGCWNAEHGHPVPYTHEDHCQAQMDLARRIHARHPHVLIEMHDTISGGSVLRYTPVYYQYGLPGSFDENWGFELMWQPMEDIRGGRARALVDYNLACNIPAYLHVDLRCDNRHALVLWWYASTCRHLGIGGAHEDPLVAQQHRLAMQRYRRLERFYKRGEFFAAGDEVHIHALPAENAFVVNLFNLSDESRIINAEIDMAALGLDRDLWYITPYNLAGRGYNRQAGTFTASRRLEPWSAQVMEIMSLNGV